MKVIHTKTKEQFATLLQIFEELGFKWNNGDRPMSNVQLWNNYGESTVLSFEPRFGYSCVFDAKRDGYQVISFNFFIKTLNNEQNSQKETR